MANVFITDRLPAVPRVATTKTTRAVNASTLGGACDVVNHMVGFRALKTGHWQVTQRDAVLTTNPKGVVHHHFAYRVGARAEHLQLVFSYQGDTPATSEIAVYMTTMGGTPVDGTLAAPAMLFSADDGTLALQESIRNVAAGSNNGFPMGFTSTGTRVVASPSLPTLPRLLNVASGAGLACIITVRVTDANLLSLSALEHYKELIPQ